MHNDHKIEWIKSYTYVCEDVGGEKLFGHTPLTLPEFVVIYGKIFGGLTTRSKEDTRVQKKLCIELFSRYDPTFKVRLDRDFAPWDLSEFERLWDPTLPSRCRECSSVVTNSGAVKNHPDYCSTACYKVVHPGRSRPGCPYCDGMLHPPRFDMRPRIKDRNYGYGSEEGAGGPERVCMECDRSVESVYVAPGVWRTLPEDPASAVEFSMVSGRGSPWVGARSSHMPPVPEVPLDAAWKRRRRNY
jgi:hypothetical protein